MSSAHAVFPTIPNSPPGNTHNNDVQTSLPDPRDSHRQIFLSETTSCFAPNVPVSASTSANEPLSNDIVDRTELFPDLAQFELTPPEPRISPWAATKIGTLEARLEALQHRLNESRHKLSPRAVILLATRVFGFNGWSSRVVAAAVSDASGDADKFAVRHTAEVEVLLADGTACRGNGRGHATNLARARAYNKSLKQATAEATKAALLLLAMALER